MPSEIPKEYSQRFIGLLTHEQKQAGYFVSQDEDFIYIFHRGNGTPILVAVLDYETARVKEVRDAAEAHRIEVLK